MSNQYDNTNSGAAFKNTYKESDKHPDLTGPLNVEGVEYQVAAWSKNSEKQGKYLSIKITKKDKGPIVKNDVASDSTDAPF